MAIVVPLAPPILRDLSTPRRPFHILVVATVIVLVERTLNIGGDVDELSYGDRQSEVDQDKRDLT